MELTQTYNPVDITTVFKEAKLMLDKGIAKVCFLPIAALDRNGNRVSLSSPNAHLLTPSGAIFKALANHSQEEVDVKNNATRCMETMAKQFPNSFAYNYDPAVSIDLACLDKTDEEILSAFDSIINREAILNA